MGKKKVKPNVKAKIEKYQELQNQIFDFCAKNNLHVIVTDMLNKAFLNKEPNPTLFMANYLLDYNNTNFEEYCVVEMSKLKNELISSNLLNEKHLSEIESLKLQINALRRQLTRNIAQMQPQPGSSRESDSVHPSTHCNYTQQHIQPIFFKKSGPTTRPSLNRQTSQPIEAPIPKQSIPFMVSIPPERVANSFPNQHSQVLSEVDIKPKENGDEEILVPEKVDEVHKLNLSEDSDDEGEETIQTSEAVVDKPDSSTSTLTETLSKSPQAAKSEKIPQAPVVVYEEQEIPLMTKDKVAETAPAPSKSTAVAEIIQPEPGVCNEVTQSTTQMDSEMSAVSSQEMSKTTKVEMIQPASISLNHVEEKPFNNLSDLVKNFASDDQTDSETDQLMIDETETESLPVESISKQIDDAVKSLEATVGRFDPAELEEFGVNELCTETAKPQQPRARNDSIELALLAMESSPAQNEFSVNFSPIKIQDETKILSSQIKQEKNLSDVSQDDFVPDYEAEDGDE